MKKQQLKNCQKLQQNSIVNAINGQSTQKSTEAIFSDPGEFRVFIINSSTMKKLEIEPRNLKIAKVAQLFVTEKTKIP